MIIQNVLNVYYMQSNGQNPDRLCKYWLAQPSQPIYSAETTHPSK